MRYLLHAPNIHAGGGKQLLEAVLSAPEQAFSWAQLDSRLGPVSGLAPDTSVYRVNPSLLSRFQAEWRLRQACGPNDVVLCFHGLPPLFRLRGRAVVFVQNRILVETSLPKGHMGFVRLRLLAERLWFRGTVGHASHYVAQSASMAALLQPLVPDGVRVSVSLVAPIGRPAHLNSVSLGHTFDFVYPASGDAHKNHWTLIEAWRLLAKAGLRPSLALTLGTHDAELWARIEEAAREFDLAITNLGWLKPTDMAVLYQKSGALIYPSRVESLGLPLIEAGDRGLPILASELDYVRDVAVPEETFDPSSALSIARAVRRFLGTPEQPMEAHSASQFLLDALE